MTLRCTCENCVLMTTEAECNCCQEHPKMREELQEAGRISQQPAAKCITLHPGFAAVCLNVWTLETAWLQYRTQYKKPFEGPQHRRYRHIAYRQLVRLVFKYLGKHIRVPLPACVVSLIRRTFPNPDDEDYVGYQRLPLLR